ncbi:hypothetical protein SLEP1_g44595 [Rubroshorea leprosula]|uniref:Uncharacterized protein n=1 Tax=Rubroshorea leprosula TaxID=152421 RepID=A0AAV5LGR5_9ROSI|nr:hypothetical protein SLEP1_g44595 [Rubroshorea leprosula]
MTKPPLFFYPFAAVFLTTMPAFFMKKQRTGLSSFGGV